MLVVVVVVGSLLVVVVVVVVVVISPHYHPSCTAGTLPCARSEVFLTEHTVVGICSLQVKSSKVK